MKLNILFIGDIVGAPGMDVVRMWLPALKKKYKTDIIIVNGENSSDGKGCTKKEGEELFELGVDVITGGNHTWDKSQSQEYLKTEPRALRPLNYPRGCYGNGFYIIENEKAKVGVLNLQGRSFMQMIDCPFRAADWALSKINEQTKITILDFHAEATAEKIALANYLDGKISMMVGTHTHIQTADERILNNGTAYITDVGMTGPYDSVIGMKKDAAINRFLYQTPQKYQAAKDEARLSAVFVEIDVDTAKANRIERIQIPEFEREKQNTEET